MIFKASIFLLISQNIGSNYFFSKKNEKQKQQNENISEKSLLCRFVLDGSGKRVGESVAINEDMVIIKSGNQFMGVPLKHVEENGKTILVKGIIDYTKAYELGETWRKASARDINDESYEKGKHRRF